MFSLSPGSIAAIYVILGSLWILLSDSRDLHIVLSGNYYQTWKGLAYVAVTGLGLYGLMRLAWRKYQAHARDCADSLAHHQRENRALALLAHGGLAAGEGAEALCRRLTETTEADMAWLVGPDGMVAHAPFTGAPPADRSAALVAGPEVRAVGAATVVAVPLPGRDLTLGIRINRPDALDSTQAPLLARLGEALAERLPA